MQEWRILQKYEEYFQINASHRNILQNLPNFWKMMKHLHEMKKIYMGFRFRITTTIWQFLKHFAKYISSSIKIIFMKSGWKQTLLGHYWAAAAKSCTKTCKISPAVIIFCDNIVVWSCIFSHINDLKLTDSAHLCS